MPPRRPRRWSEAEVDPYTRERLARIFAALWALPSEDTDERPRPVQLPLTPDAKGAWVRFVEAHGAELAERVGDLAAAWGKLEGYAARLALILHCCRLAEEDGDLADAGRVAPQSVEAAVALVRWFGRETERVYAVLREAEDESADRSALEWIGSLGATTVREFQRAFARHYATAAVAEEALERLARAGRLRSEERLPGPKGGRPATVYRLP
jgi:hypothetical protein